MNYVKYPWQNEPSPCLDNITTMPYMYPEYDQNPKYRKAVVEYDYLVFYQIEQIENKDRARIFRVLHGKRDIVPILESEF